MADTRLYREISQALQDFALQARLDERSHVEIRDLASWLRDEHQGAFARHGQILIRRRIEDRLRKDQRFLEAVAYLMGDIS